MNRNTTENYLLGLRNASLGLLQWRLLHSVVVVVEVVVLIRIHLGLLLLGRGLTLNSALFTRALGGSRGV